IIQVSLGETFDLWREDAVPARLARRGHGGQRAAMEAVIEGNDLVGAIALELAPLARQLDGALVGLGPAVCEEDAVETGCPRNAFGKVHGRLVVKRRGRIDQGLGL